MIGSLLVSSAFAQKKYQRPPTQTPDTFRGGDSPSTTDQSSIGDLKWFEVFKDAELQKLVRTAMAASLLVPCALFAFASWNSYGTLAALTDELWQEELKLNLFAAVRLDRGWSRR